MASLGALWWMTPIQAIAALSAGLNSGASGLQSPLTMPMLELPDVPAVYAGKQIRWLLDQSDKLFPKVNAFGTFTNLAMTIVCFVKRDQDRSAREKLPILAAAFLCNMGATVWSLGIMVPINSGMRKYSAMVEQNPSDEKSEKELRRLQAKWKPRALGRAAIMLSACALGMYSVFLDGRYQ